MTINQAIASALDPMSLPCEPDINTITGEEYITFNYFTTVECAGSNQVQIERYGVQLHYCCPLGFNCLSKLDQIKRLVFAAGFTWPTMTDETDTHGQRWVFECDYLIEVG